MVSLNRPLRLDSQLRCELVGNRATYVPGFWSVNGLSSTVDTLILTNLDDVEVIRSQLRKVGTVVVVVVVVVGESNTELPNCWRWGEGGADDAPFDVQSQRRRKHCPKRAIRSSNGPFIGATSQQVSQGISLSSPFIDKSLQEELLAIIPGFLNALQDIFLRSV